MVLPFVVVSVAMVRQLISGGHMVLNPQDIALLREALSYWAEHAGPSVDAIEVDLEALYALLTPDKVRYIIVDGDSNHAINTRMFRKVPKLHPDSGRWHVRTVLG